MKIVGILSIILGLTALSAGIYLSIEIMPNYNSILESTYNFTDLDRALLKNYSEQKSLFELIVFISAPLSILIGFIAGFKKVKIGWLGFGLGVIAFVTLLVGTM